MANKAPHYIVILESGKVWSTPYTTLRDIMRGIFREHQSAGTNWDRPKMLIRNAVVVIDDALADVAWTLGQKETAIRRTAEVETDKIFAKFTADYDFEETGDDE